jgi:hypothetical protein
LTVTSDEGNRFPSAPFKATLVPEGELPTIDNAEIVLVTAKTDDTFTITRAQSVTTAKNIAVGWRIFNGIYADHTTQSGMIRANGPEYTSTYAYVGYEHETNGSWFIYRRTRSTGVKGYAEGLSDYATNWTGKAGLTYA